jgi:hypothetical protein
MFFCAQGAAILVVRAGKALVVETQRQLITLIDGNIALGEKYVLIARERISVQLRQQKALDAGRLREEVRRIDEVRQCLALPVVSEKKRRDSV